MTLVREVDPSFVQLHDGLQVRAHATMQRVAPLVPPECSPQVEYEFTPESMKAAIRSALGQGFFVVWGTPQTLLLDLDGSAVIESELLQLICELVHEVPVMTQWKSKDGVGTHVVLRFANTTFTPAQAVSLEMALGSDRKRGLLCAMRLKNGIEEPRCLFMPTKTLPRDARHGTQEMVDWLVTNPNAWEATLGEFQFFQEVPE